MTVSVKQIERDIKNFLADSYPKIEVRVTPWDQDPSRLAVFFVEEKFVHLYPMQRFHYLTHLIPQEYQSTHLENSIWFELAPGEDPAALRYPDDELIANIKSDVLKCLNLAGFFRELDDLLCPEPPTSRRAGCRGDYRNSKPILLRRGFIEGEFFEVFHVLMTMGGYCDCEILYNAVETSRLQSEYWKARAEGRQPHDPHHES